MWGLVVVAATLVYLIQTSQTEGWYGWVTNLWSKGGLTGWSPMRPQAGYQHNCLTSTPYGFKHPGYLYFKNLERDFKKQYSHCDNYGCYGNAEVKQHTAQTSLKPMKSLAHSVELEYYEDQTGYCKRHPDRYPCPNYWIYQHPATRPLAIAKRPHRPTENYYFPPMKEGVEPQAVTHCNNKDSHTLSKCQVNDNDRMLLVYPDMEDHATC